MSVHKRRYQMYTGGSAPASSPWLVVSRFGALELFEMKRLTAYLVLCLVPWLGFAAYIYVTHNPVVLALLGVPPLGARVMPVDARFFLRCVAVQGFFAFILALWVGPGLLAPDLANGALPLLLSRPLSRFEYVGGKMVVLAGLLSLVTWLPNIFLFILQAALERDWLLANLRIGAAILVGSGIWIAFLSLVALALSAWVKRRITASLIMFGGFVFGQAMATIWVNVLENPWGRMADIPYTIGRVWRDLFGVDAGPSFLRNGRPADLPTSAAWVSLLAVCGACLWLLHRRVRAREIVR